MFPFPEILEQNVIVLLQNFIFQIFSFSNINTTNIFQLLSIFSQNDIFSPKGLNRPIPVKVWSNSSVVNASLPLYCHGN